MLVAMELTSNIGALLTKGVDVVMLIQWKGKKWDRRYSLEVEIGCLKALLVEKGL